MTVQSIEIPAQAQQIAPKGWTFVKVFWSATWRCAIYMIPFLIPVSIPLSRYNGQTFEMFHPVSYDIYFLIIGTIFLFIGMWKLNRIIYKQDNDLVSIKISPESILFYLLLINIPYLIVLIISYASFGKTNEWLMFFVGTIPNLFIFYRMMTKDIMGFKMSTWKINQGN